MASSVKEDGNEVTLMIKWGGKEYKVTVGGEDSVKDVKRRIYEQTNVLPKRQKLLNLKVKGKLADDDALVGELALKPGLKIMMMGTAEEELLVEPEEAPEILDDFDVGEEETVDIKDREENLLKVQKRIEQYKINVLNPPRAGKRLLVLDVDYTIFDHRSTAETPAELQRPYLHEFLTACYAEFDLMIWSATSMKWVEVKMRELGVLSNPDYKITAMLDHGAMITVTSNSRVFDCKPLAVIWAKFPEYYHEGNTVMFDDLRRNFVMNPKNGLVIRPFRKAHLNRDNDRELVALTRYLLAISELEDFSTLEHGRWEEFSSRRHPN